MGTEGMGARHFLLGYHSNHPGRPRHSAQGAGPVSYRQWGPHQSHIGDRGRPAVRTVRTSNLSSGVEYGRWNLFRVSIKHKETGGGCGPTSGGPTCAGRSTCEGRCCADRVSTCGPASAWNSADMYGSSPQGPPRTCCPCDLGKVA